MRMPSVNTKNEFLPFEGGGFSWTTFEAFFCDFLSAGVTLKVKGVEAKVERARLYGTRGFNQKGIDIECTMSNGEIWAVQCKLYKQWGPSNTKKAVDKFTHEATRCILAVTKLEVGEAARKPLPENWELWDGREITNKFIHGMADRKQDAADIIYRHFGDGWPEQFFDIKGRNPFLGTESFYSRLLEDGRAFDLRGPLIGRDKDLKKLSSFLDSKKRALNVIAKGGFGKSRLLLEWGRTISRRDATVVFLSRGSADREQLAKYLDLMKGSVVMIVEDAHRREDELAAVLAAIHGRSDIKLVLTQRPGMVAKVRRELLEHDIDTREIESHELKRLTRAASRELAESSLGHSRPDLNGFIANLARSSPLMAVLTAKLALDGKLGQQLADTDDFRDLVLTKVFEREKEAFKNRLPLAPVNDLLHSLALLSPFRRDQESMVELAEFLEVKFHTLSDYLDGLLEFGLLVETRQKKYWSEEEIVTVRIEPDILSDHLAYEACLSKSGTTRAFVERMFHRLSDTGYKRHIFINLAVVDWRASQAGTDTPFDIVWTGLRKTFETGSEHYRGEFLRDLASISRVQPARVLELVRWTVENGASEIPEESLIGEFFSADYSRDLTIKQVIARLSEIANTHPSQASDCLDLLWKIHRDIPEDQDGWAYRGTAIAAMKGIATMEVWKNPETIYACHDWLDRICDSPDSLEGVNLAWFLPHMLEPSFETMIEEMWQQKFGELSGREYFVPLRLARNLRGQVLDFCEARVARAPRWQLALVTLLEIALRPPWSRHPMPASLKEAIEEARVRALQILEKMIGATEHPLVLCIARRQLLDHLDAEKLEPMVSNLLRKIPDTLELRLVRVLSRSSDDFEDLVRKNDEELDFRERIKAEDRRFEEFATATVQAFIRAYSDASDGFAKLVSVAADMKALGSPPFIRPFLVTLARSDPTFALGLARHILSAPESPLSTEYGFLVAECLSNETDQRLERLAEGLQHPSFLIRGGTVEALGWLRRTGQHDEALSQLMLDFLSDSDRAAPYGGHILREWTSEPIGPFSKEVIRLLPPVTSEQDAGRFVRLLRAIYLPAKLPEAEMSTLLEKLSLVPSLDKCSDGLARLSELYKYPVFRLLENRLERSEEKSFRSIPHDIKFYRIDKLLGHPDVASKARAFIQRFIDGGKWTYEEARFYAHVSSSGASEFFEPILISIEAPEQLSQLESFFRNFTAMDVSRRNPLLLKALLIKAEELGAEPLSSRKQEGGVYVNGEPGKDWQASTDHTRALATQYANDPVLGPFYAEMARIDMDEVNQMRQNHVEQARLFEDS